MRNKFGLIVPQYGILNVLAVTGPISQNELCESLEIDKATMVKLIDGLEKKRYVERVASADDRRVKKIQMTRLGVKTRDALLEIARSVEHEFLSPLTAQEAKLIKRIIPKLVME